MEFKEIQRHQQYLDSLTNCPTKKNDAARRVDHGRLPTVLFHYALWSEAKVRSHFHLQHLSKGALSHSRARIHGDGSRSGKTPRGKKERLRNSRI